MSGGDTREEGTLLQRLWATWRMHYISSLATEGEEECVFCAIQRQEDGPGNLVVHRGSSCYIVLNLYPYNNGHAMVVPYRHVGDLAELNDQERCELMSLAALLQRALSSKIRAQGFNLGMNLGRVGGAGIPGHVHLHLVPRWLGDTNFMPVVGQTKVMPEALEETYEKVKSAITELAEREKAEG